MGVLRWTDSAATMYGKWAYEKRSTYSAFCFNNSNFSWNASRVASAMMSFSHIAAFWSIASSSSFVSFLLASSRTSFSSFSLYISIRSSPWLVLTTTCGACSAWTCSCWTWGVTTLKIQLQVSKPTNAKNNKWKGKLIHTQMKITIYVLSIAIRMWMLKQRHTLTISCWDLGQQFKGNIRYLFK